MPWGGNVSTDLVSKEHQLLGDWGFVLFSNFRLNSISELGNVLPSCYCQDVLAERVLPAVLDPGASQSPQSPLSQPAPGKPSYIQDILNLMTIQTLQQPKQGLETSAASCLQQGSRLQWQKDTHQLLEWSLVEVYGLILNPCKLRLHIVYMYMLRAHVLLCSGYSPCFVLELVWSWGSHIWHLVELHCSSLAMYLAAPGPTFQAQLPDLDFDLLHHQGWAWWSRLLDEPEFYQWPTLLHGVGAVRSLCCRLWHLSSSLHFSWGATAPCCTLTLRDLTHKQYSSASPKFQQVSHSHSPSDVQMHPLKKSRQKLSLPSDLCNIRLQLCYFFRHFCTHFTWAPCCWMPASPNQEALWSFGKPHW